MGVMMCRIKHRGKTFVLSSNRFEYQVYEEKFEKEGGLIKSDIGHYYDIKFALKSLFEDRLPKASYARTKESFLKEIKNLSSSVAEKVIKNCANELEKENFKLKNKILDLNSEINKLRKNLKKGGVK